MLTHPAVAETIQRTPPDAVAIAAYLLLFAAVAAATQRRPAFGIAALVLLEPFAFYHDVGATTITFPKVALLATLSGLAVRKADLRVLGAPAARTLLLCAVAVLAATALSIAQAAFREPALRETLKAAQYALLFATVVVAARADPDDRVLRVAFSASVVAVGALALAQEITGAPSALGTVLHPIPRIAGPLEGPNQLAGYLGIALCAVAALFARHDSLLGRVALCLGGAALALTFSRAGVATTVLALTIVALLSPRRHVRAGVASLAGGAVAGVILLGAWRFAAEHSESGILALYSEFFARFSSLSEAADPGSVGSRPRLWHAALVLWQRHPAFGIGAGNFELELASAGYRGVRTHANSLYLQALAEGGIPLFGATLALGCASIARFVRGPFAEPLVVAALAASTGFALHQVFDLLVFYPKVGELWWILLGLGAARFDAVRRSLHAS